MVRGQIGYSHVSKETHVDTLMRGQIVNSQIMNELMDLTHTLDTEISIETQQNKKKLKTGSDPCYLLY